MASTDAASITRRCRRRPPTSNEPSLAGNRLRLENAAVVAAFQRLRIGTTRQAHAAAHRAEGVVAVGVGPPLEALAHAAQRGGTLFEQDRGELDAVGAGHD